MLGFIFRSTKYFTNYKSIMRLYYPYVRSRLDYCSTVWNPHYVKYVDQIERVQKKFTRMLYYKFNWVKPDYKTRLKQLNMTSLETRRLQLDEITLYKPNSSTHHLSAQHRYSFQRPMSLRSQSAAVLSTDPLYFK